MRFHRPALLVVTVAAVAAVLGACGQDQPATDPGPAATASQQAPTRSPDRSATATPAASSAPASVDDGATDDTAPGGPDAPAAAQALTRATATMRAFARTDLNQDAWWAGVRGYFTPAAEPIYKSTDVQNVPVHQITEGSAKLLPGATPYRAEVAVGTDNGIYTVTLIRADGDWLVDRTEPAKP